MIARTIRRPDDVFGNVVWPEGLTLYLTPESSHRLDPVVADRNPAAKAVAQCRVVRRIGLLMTRQEAIRSILRRDGAEWMSDLGSTRQVPCRDAKRHRF